MGAAVGVYQETLAALYDYFIPYPIEKLHTSNRGHVSVGSPSRARCACPGNYDLARLRRR